MIVETRYCQSCKNYTQHDSVVANGRGPMGAIERLFFGILSVGMTELLNAHYWQCQRCNTRIYR